ELTNQPPEYLKNIFIYSHRRSPVSLSEKKKHPKKANIMKFGNFFLAIAASILIGFKSSGCRPNPAFVQSAGRIIKPIGSCSTAKSVF
ncbi:hypothetical protein PTTG_29836, partial [Puccinia triticina 1-1 BBBD Race 1]